MNSGSQGLKLAKLMIAVAPGIEVATLHGAQRVIGFVSWREPTMRRRPREANRQWQGKQWRTGSVVTNSPEKAPYIMRKVDYVVW